MDLSRESQTSTNTSEVEESFHCLFLLSIRYYYFAFNFVSTTSPLSKFRIQTHVIARALARPVENKVLLEVVLSRRQSTVYRSLSSSDCSKPSSRDTKFESLTNDSLRTNLFHLSSALTFPTSSFHVPLETRSILFLTKYDKIIS